MNLDEITALAKRASTPDTKYIVEAKLTPGEPAEVVIRRIVDLTGIELCYGKGQERPLDEAITRMRLEAEALDNKARKAQTRGRHIGIDRNVILGYIAEYESMNSGEGPRVADVSRFIGTNAFNGPRYHLDKLEELHLIRHYLDPLDGARRYKVVKHK